MRYFLIFSTLLLAAFLPSVAFAAPTTFKAGIEMIIGWTQTALAVVFSAMWIGIAWGVVVYLINYDNEAKRESIKGYLFWAVIGVTVVFAVWGIVGVLHSSIFGGTFGFILLTPPK